MQKSGKFFAGGVLFSGALLAGCAIWPGGAQPTVAQNTGALATQGAAGGQITGFDGPFLFAYGTWENKVKIAGGIAQLRGAGVNAQGGAGNNVNLNLSASADASPALRIKVGPNNKATGLNVLLKDAGEQTASYQFELPAPTGEFITLTPKDGASLAQPNSLEKKGQALDLSKIVQWQIQGNWSAGALDVDVDAILLATASDDVLQARESRAQREKQERDRNLREQQALLDRYQPGTPLSPRVVSTYAAAPGILAVQIEAGKITPGALMKYSPQPGDTRKEEKNKDGNVRTVKLQRGGQEIGWLTGPQRDHLVLYEKYEGDPLLTFLADDAKNFRVSSTDDANFKTAVAPTATHRKSKPLNWSNPGRQFVMRHTIYLKLPKNLTPGKSYAVALGDLNTLTPSASFTFNPTKVRSEAVHVNQIGYRPDDAPKRAFLSLWLGTGGAYEYSKDLSFSVVDDKTGKKALSGKVELAKAANETEFMWKDKNYNKTNVYRMDFSDLKTPGRYRIVVDGVGTSYPFDIADDVWQRAFKIQMAGLYNQRSGVETGPPYSDFKKPRDFHPADGAKILQSEYSIMEGHGESPNLAKSATTQEISDAWGGYHDAGDWNPRRVTHMEVTRAQLEIFELFPSYFEKMDLSIPAAPKIPDVITEALFEIDCWRRMQKPDGGVPFGIETDGDPIEGEVSWLQSMTAYVFAPDARSSFYYASLAARAARVLEKYDASLAKTYRDSAVKAMNWAEVEYSKLKADGETKKLDWTGHDARNLAALELYVLTGDQKWHDVFLQDTFLNKPGRKVFAWGVGVQRDAAFLYARMDEKLGDAELRRKAREAIVGEAESALNYASGNAWNLTTPDKGKPMFQGFYTTPDATELARAHFLTKDAKFLRGVVQATQYQSGANPINMTFTTGLGQNPPQNPLKLDSRLTGQKTPVGITVYGPRDSDWDDWSKWVFDYFLNKELTPALSEWPVPETYFDIFLHPSTNEYTVDVWAPNVFVWGYLAARPAATTP